MFGSEWKDEGGEKMGDSMYLKPEKWLDKRLEKPLKEVLEDAFNRLTMMERARVLIAIARRINVKPEHAVKTSIEWKE